MTNTRIPAVIDALYAVFDAALDIPVYDGPVVTETHPPACATVGFDGDPEGDMKAASSKPEWAGLGAKRRNEEIEVVCSIVVQRGGGNIKAVRDEAFGFMQLVDTALIADPSIGLSSPTTARVDNPQYYQTPVSGAGARVVFTVCVDTRI